MIRKLITCGFIAGCCAQPLTCALANELPTAIPATQSAPISIEPTKPSVSIEPGAPLASKLAAETTITDSADRAASAVAANTEASSAPAPQYFFSEGKQHTLSADALKAVNNLYLNALPEKADRISPLLKRALGDHYEMFTANYRVQSPLIWTGDILAGWGMLPHSGGSSRAEFFIHRNGQLLIVITIEQQQYYFGAKQLLKNAYVMQELATSAQTH